MCGIFGWQYDDDAVTPEERAIVGVMLASGTESRGRDSCGYALFDPLASVTRYRKETGAVMRSTLMTEMVTSNNLMGHTRYATVGEKTVENAHPWHLGHLIGAHNGGVFNYVDLNEKYESRHFAVDSMHIIQHINDDLDVTELNGYGTVEWMDTRDPGAIYLCALARGDLEVEVLGDNKHGIVWASARTTLTDALRLAGLYTKSTSFRAQTGVVYRIFGGMIEATDRRLAFGTSERAITKYTTPTHWAAAKDWDWSNGQWTWDTEAKASVWERTPKAKPKTECKLKVVPPAKKTTMTRKQSRRYEKLLAMCEKHRDMCVCPLCQELFNLAVLDQMLAENA